MTEYSTNWENIDLNSPCERNLELISGLTFQTFLMEIDSNLPEITEKTVRAQFEEDLRRINQEARWVFEKNLKNITQYAEAYRKDS